MFNKLKTAFVLVIIGGLSGLIIFGVNEITKDEIEKNIRLQEESYYKELFDLEDDFDITYDKLDIDGDLDQEIIIYDDSLNTVGYIYKYVTVNGYGDITVLVGLKLDGTISKVVIASTGNTPNYVKRIESNYLENFIDQDITDVSIDSSTGASFTYGSVVESIGFANDYYSLNRGDE